MREELERLRLALPDRGKWSLLIPLTQVEDGVWEGRAENDRGQTVTLQYTKKEGLIVLSTGG